MYELRRFHCIHGDVLLVVSLQEEFEQLYERYEKEGRARATVKAQKLWFAILESQTETGTPYMLYKDACNRKSNQQVIIYICLQHSFSFCTHNSSLERATKLKFVQLFGQKPWTIVHGFIFVSRKKVLGKVFQSKGNEKRNKWHLFQLRSTFE